MNKERDKICYILETHKNLSAAEKQKYVTRFLMINEEFDPGELDGFCEIARVGSALGHSDLRINAIFRWEAYVRGDDTLINLIESICKSTRNCGYKYLKMVAYLHLVSGGCPVGYLSRFFTYDETIKDKQVTDCTNMFMQYIWTNDIIRKLLEKNITISRLAPTLVELQPKYEGIVPFNPDWAKHIYSRVSIRSNGEFSDELYLPQKNYPINRSIFTPEKGWKL